MKQLTLFDRLTELIEGLELVDLECINFAGGRIWVDTGSLELAITLWPLEDASAHAEEMAGEPSFGKWVWTPPYPITAVEHPLHADGVLNWERPGIADRERQRLLASVEAMVLDLEFGASESRA